MSSNERAERNDRFLLALYDLADGKYDPPEWIEHDRVFGAIGYFDRFAEARVIVPLSVRGLVQRSGARVALTRLGAEYVRALRERKAFGEG